MNARDELEIVIANSATSWHKYGPRYADAANAVLAAGYRKHCANTTNEAREEMLLEVEAAYESEVPVVDYLIAAGYSKPRTITTVEELDDLPVGSVILDPIGLSLHKNEFTGWGASNGAKNITAEMLRNEALPATVLHEGAAA